MELKHAVNLVIGDASLGKTEVITVKSNFDQFVMADAYAKGAMIIGVDVTKDVAKKFGDSSISKSDLDKFKEHNLDLSFFGYGSDDLQADEETGSLFLHTELFAALYLFTVKVGDPDFKFEQMKHDEINIGGYGLFDVD